MASAKTVKELNSMATDSVLLTLLKLEIPNTPTVYLVNNPENITWNNNEYISFQFELDDLTIKSKSEVPQWGIKVQNVDRVFERFIQQYDLYIKQNGIDGNAIICTISVVNSADLTETNPIIEYATELDQPKTTPDSKFYTAVLRPSNPGNKEWPPRRIMKNFCSWKFRSAQCGFTGTGATCDKTLPTCRGYDNSNRFGGFPGVGAEGLVIVK